MRSVPRFPRKCRIPWRGVRKTLACRRESLAADRLRQGQLSGPSFGLSKPSSLSQKN
jgi:hypothetical protein